MPHIYVYQVSEERTASVFMVKIKLTHILFEIFPTRCNITQFIYFWKTALHVSGGIFTHHQEHTQLYLQYLVLDNRYCYLPL